MQMLVSARNIGIGVELSLQHWAGVWATTNFRSSRV
jgi:hypothetical protein